MIVLVVIIIILLILYIGAKKVNNDVENKEEMNQEMNEDDSLNYGDLFEMLAEKHNVSREEIKLDPTFIVDNYIRGNITINEETNLFIVSSEKGAWEILFEGSGVINCALFEDYSFPQALIADCQAVEIETETE